jgi:phosphopantetheinyl transferase (holo-ACP synthase)
MNALYATIITIFVTLYLCVVAQAEDSLFPNPAQVKSDKPSLESAVAQFEGVLQDSTAGQRSSLQSNDQYNQKRTEELGRLLAEKQKYLQSIPDIVSRQFEALMQRFAGSDQQTKNKMASDLRAQWQAKEAQVKQEITDLEEQLGVTGTRLSDSAVQRQMLEVSTALAESEGALQQKQTPGQVDLNAENPAFADFRLLTVQRMLSRIQGFCSIQVKSLEDDLSIHFLDN